ncbi:hypothetical protein [Flavimarina sp. Hel_I_48]|uniref:hypothetical protein n=1 Tax=Flavimarina sp. Hel_I_48 TaxID=1392488 RepID=UPI0004DF877F|nr:hypothetical protein [Flavimarina sp. Hel_I_48]
MKKVLYTVAVLAMAFTSLTSCESNSDDAPTITDTSNILPVQVDVVNPDGEIEVVRFSYDGMKLIKTEFIDGYRDYIYEDGLIIENNVYDADGEVEILESYTYDAQGRVDTIVTDIANASTNTYALSYNEDNSEITNSLINDDDLYEDSINTLRNGNMVKADQGSSYITTYTYDNNKGFFQNIEQREILVTIDSENNYPAQFSLNNILSEDRPTGFFKENAIYTYTYTDSNFPRTMTENREGEITTYTFTYNND